jgi:hypothetical protein
MNTSTRSDTATFRETSVEGLPAATDLDDRRATPRYPVNTLTSCPYVLPVVEDIGPSRIKDISTEGIGLLCSRAVEPGAMIVVGIMNAHKNFCRTQLVQVVHSTKLVGGVYQVGGLFLTPLTYDELRNFVM